MATPLEDRTIVSVVQVNNEYLQVYVDVYGRGVKSWIDNCYTAEETAERIAEELKKKGW